jgi:nucleotide-binding universal stress UspA family protein
VGNPAASLIEAAEGGAPERRLIAVGSRGLGTVQQLRVGSVPTKVLRASRGPVLIVTGIVAKRGVSRARSGIGDQAGPGA